MKWVTREGAKTDRVACPWLESPVYDALYAWCQAKAAGRPI